MMKLLLKIIIGALVMLALFFAATHIFFAARGRALLIEKLEAELQKEVSIAEARLIMPLKLEITGLEISDLLKADYVYITPQLTGFLTGKIVLNELEILRPEFTWASKPANKAAEDNPGGGNKPKKERDLPLFINKLSIKHGRINLIDRAVSKDGLAITLREIQLMAENLSFFPESAITNFQLAAELAGQKDSAPGKIIASGWMDIYQKNMRAELNIDNIDGIYFYPYYSHWVDLENARIKEARLNFSSQINSENNDLTALCRLELADIKFRPREPDKPEHRAEKITAAVLGIFRSLGQGRVILNFTIKTKMDKPEFRFESISSAVDKKLSQAVQGGNIKIEDIIVLPGRLVEGMTKGTTGATRAIIEGALSMGKTLSDAFLDAFKKPEQDSQEPTENQEGSPD